MHRALTLLLLLAGPGSCKDDDECLPGTEGCPCLGADGLCATGLYCAANVCRSEDMMPIGEDEGGTTGGGTGTGSGTESGTGTSTGSGPGTGATTSG